MGSVAEREWWRDAVVYQVYVRSFADANGDGNVMDFGVGKQAVTLDFPGVEHFAPQG